VLGSVVDKTRNLLRNLKGIASAKASYCSPSRAKPDLVSR
jgi:hypothetical protein